MSSEATWINPITTSGQGAATVNYSVLPNPSATPRQGRVVVAEEAVEVRQAPAPCRYEVSPTTLSVAAAGGESSVRLTAPDGCHWTVHSDVPWIRNLVPAEGIGGATVRLTVTQNTAAARGGTVTIGNATVTVNQSSAAGPSPPAPSNPDPPSPVPACNYGVSPTRVAVRAAGEQASIEVTAGAECHWTATSSATWIALASGGTGSGNGSVRVTVGANTGSARTGTIRVAERTVTIEQAAAPTETTCSYRLAETTRNVGPEPEEFTVGVTASPACAWTVSSDAAWITVAGGRSGSGSGSFRVAVARNAGGARTGTVRVATEMLRIHQATGTCTYGIKPTYYNAGRGPDEILINVTAESGCSWNATTNAPWVTIEGRSGSGSGTVRLLIPANTDSPRMAVVTIAGHTFTLRQDGICSTSIKPTYYNAGRGPDDIRIAVTAEPGCTWTAASSVAWVSVAEGAAASGNGLVRLLVQPNSGAPRSVTLTIAGQPFALRQEGSP